MSLADLLNPYVRPFVTALYGLYVILMIIGLVGALDFASVVVGCLSAHLGGAFFGWVLGGRYHPYNHKELGERFPLFLQILDAVQLVTLIVSATQLNKMPMALVNLLERLLKLFHPERIWRRKHLQTICSQFISKNLRTIKLNYQYYK